MSRSIEIGALDAQMYAPAPDDETLDGLRQSDRLALADACHEVIAAMHNFGSLRDSLVRVLRHMKANEEKNLREEGVELRTIDRTQGYLSALEAVETILTKPSALAQIRTWMLGLPDEGDPGAADAGTHPEHG